jgi:hypothetical protein
MTILSHDTGYTGFDVIDDATGQKIRDVLWVDPLALEVVVPSLPLRIDPITGEVVKDCIKISSVRVDFSTREIHVNQPKIVSIQIGARVSEQEPRACEECCQPQTCERIHYCAAWKCGFGEANKP